MAGCILRLFSLSGCWQWYLRSTPAVSGSRLALASLVNPKTFNYIVNYEFPSVFQFIYEGLTRRNGITGEIRPLAKVVAGVLWGLNKSDRPLWSESDTLKNLTVRFLRVSRVLKEA